MGVRYLLFFLFFFTSCMPTPTVSRNGLTDSENSSDDTPVNDLQSTPLQWNYLGGLKSFITINAANLNNAYIIGSQVENYLSIGTHYTNANYCLISSFDIGGEAFELRSRIIPLSYYDFYAKRTVKVLRVDFQDVTNSTTFCDKTKQAFVKDSTGNYVADPSTPAPVKIFNNPALLCSNCTSSLTASRVRVFRHKDQTSSLEEVPQSSLQMELLSMQVDPNNGAISGPGSCSNTSCQNLGFDCCLENQCVNDGAVRPSASSLYSGQLQMAEQEKLTNPLAYQNYPHLYYVCGSSVSSGGGTSSGGSSSGGSSGIDEAFEQLKKDYQCQEYLRSKSSSTPFHQELLSTDFSPGTAECLTDASSLSDPSYYKNVMSRLYKTCGCGKDELSEMITYCPSYEYIVSLKDNSNEPLKIDCYTPPTLSPPLPLQQSVNLSSRSAPHRFFDKDGVEKGPAAASEQEGDAFFYQDNENLLPIQSSFSMNALLGQMSVTLDKTLPAKVVAVELDGVYFIHHNQGVYTPCPDCAKDSWFNSFSAYPQTNDGIGLEARGHTTQRDTFSTNTTAGNYEDTIFGRACWLPPTMIPFSHSPKVSLQEQRLTRLKTQAALFINGYQKDWYGFNKGALIGSFDGVTWFAIGNGRIVRATSSKLFLALNAPFADLATPSFSVVNIKAYDGITQATELDYDPQYHQYHPYQNRAGSCQKYHLCETDTDCVTRLGWEYVCADVKSLKTTWPDFDASANEKSNTSLTLTLDQILQQKRFPSSSTKRCVYRGAGAVCHTNSVALPSGDLNKRKLLTCAPNFFCASTSSSYHNHKVARYGADLEDIPVAKNHFFGKDANILGRPHDYHASSSLDSDVRSTLANALSSFDSGLSSYIGLCQPGKRLPDASNEGSLNNPFTQHASGDPGKRSDFINQIASCNSTLFSPNRHSSCPVIGTNGNYEMFNQGTLPSDYQKRATNQNACGLESLLSTANLSSSADTLLASSPFQYIEAKPLHSQTVLNPSLVRDACLRRAGAVCHTDLDCSPNKFHEEQTGAFNLSFFGNEAERNYWSESLVCGQEDPKPFPSDEEAFRNYDMSKNRCCREIGKTLTTYTSDFPTSTTGESYDQASAGLITSVAPGIDPNNEKRYSRLATVNLLESAVRPLLSSYQKRAPFTQTLLTKDSVNALTDFQWRTLNEANSKTCCGGGWIRLFSDGPQDWTRTNRVILDVENFRCLNSRTPLLTRPEEVKAQYISASDVQNLVGLDRSYYCGDPTGTTDSCAQYSFENSSLEKAPQDDPFPNSITINTVSPNYADNPDFYFMPLSADSDPQVTINYGDNSLSARRNITLKIPSYISRKFDSNYTSNSLTIKMVSASGSDDRICIKNESQIHPDPPYDPTHGPSSGTNACYYSYNETSRVLRVTGTSDLYGSGGDFENKTVGIEFSAEVAGYDNGTSLYRKSPGSNTFYLKRLGLLELSGIPQITFPPLMCSDNSDKLVPGIFSPQVTDKNHFEDETFSFDNGSGDHFTNHHGLAHEPVFSAHEFKCCSPLGKTVSSASLCCSGYAVSEGQSGLMQRCALPSGVDLMVYFNAFVSNEGRKSTDPGGGLSEEDFDDQTGAPLLSTSVNNKIRALGESYCESGRVRQGGAFGSFEPEPQGPRTNVSERIYNIVDSSSDSGQISNAGTTITTGYGPFMEGFRWNHHLYCDF